MWSREVSPAHAVVGSQPGGPCYLVPTWKQPKNSREIPTCRRVLNTRRKTTMIIYHPSIVDPTDALPYIFSYPVPSCCFQRKQPRLLVVFNLARPRRASKIQSKAKREMNRVVSASSSPFKTPPRLPGLTKSHLP